MSMDCHTAFERGFGRKKQIIKIYNKKNSFHVNFAFF